MADLPKLKGLDGHAGFEFVDPDGVYRTYIANGTVIDAARLTAAQIQTWIDARAPHLSEAEAAKERETLAGIDSQSVSDAQLLAPAEDHKPKALLESFAAEVGISARDEGPLVAKRQGGFDCPSFYCVQNAAVCSVYPNCWCNGVLCTTI